MPRSGLFQQEEKHSSKIKAVCFTAPAGTEKVSGGEDVCVCLWGGRQRAQARAVSSKQLVTS